MGLPAGSRPPRAYVNMTWSWPENLGRKGGGRGAGYVGEVFKGWLVCLFLVSLFALFVSALVDGREGG